MDNDKKALRSRLLAARAELTPDQRSAAAGALARRGLELAAELGARTVAGYVSIGAEPGTRELIEALRTRGLRVLLPVLLPDNDLDWARYTGPEGLVRAGRGLLEPAGPRLGPDAVAGADLVLLPGLAVDRASGVRLGRGGGSYDRVLARLEAASASPAGSTGQTGSAAPLLATLLYRPELLDGVPAEAHDRPVDAVLTPAGLTRWA
jgi:5-formyltetrahydrofolate cyclo-ligase